MAEKRIEIQMAAVGAQEAASAINQSTEAVKGLSAATDDQTKATAAAATEEKQGTQINIERAKILKDVADKTAMVGEAIRKSAEDFRESDPATAKTLETMASGLEQVGGMAAYAAQGFAVAGPAGAAVGAAAAVASTQLRALYDAYVELVQANSDAEDSFKTLAEAEENHARHHEEMAARRLAAGFRQMLKDEATAAQNLAIELAALDKIEASRNRLATAKRDREDDAAIAAGADPDAVHQKRIADDAKAEKDRIDQALDRQRAEANRAEYLADKATKDAIKYRSMNGADPEKADEMEKAAKEQIEAAEKAAKEYQTAREIGDNDKQTIDERAANKKEEIEAAAAKRRQAVIDQHNEDNIRAEIEAQQQAEAEERKADADAARQGLNQSATGAASKFGIAAGRAPTRAVGTALDRIGTTLEDGTNAREIEKLQQQFSKATAGMGGATVRALAKMLAEMEAQAKKIEEIDKRTKTRPIGL